MVYVLHINKLSSHQQNQWVYKLSHVIK